MVHRKSPKQLAKIITYVLGRKPGEFGLVPDPCGYIKIKEFLKAMGEEEGFKYVRRSHIDEILISLPDPPIEIKDNYIRAAFRDNLPTQNPIQSPPKLLYTGVRRKAYPVVLANGIFPMDFKKVILSSEPNMAQRIAKRKDRLPIMLTVKTRSAIAKGIIFYEAGDTLFLAESIPTGCFTGPPPPKEKSSIMKQETPTEERLPKLRGSFILDPLDIDASKKDRQQKKKKKGIAWRKEQKRKKHKPDREPPPWRS